MTMVKIILGCYNYEAIQYIKSAFPDCHVQEMDSFGADTVTEILIPVATFIGASSPIIIQLLKRNDITIKYKGIELSGTYSKIVKVISQLKALDDIAADHDLSEPAAEDNHE